MGIYNLIHDNTDEQYYYCPVNDCPCHQPDYYDSSRNHNNFYDFESSSNNRPNNHNGTTTNVNNNPRNSFTGYLN
jgi:hypothetical protein